jgi:hypothetical protein
MKWYSQTDKQWSKEKLGFSNLTIGGYGCTITSIANWLQFYGWFINPSQVNQALKDVRGFANDKYGNKALVIWSKVGVAFPQMKHIKRVLNYNNWEVAWWVYGKKTPVLVECQVKNFRHWVLFIGNRQMVDPLIGGIRPTSTWRLTGYSLFQKV